MSLSQPPCSLAGSSAFAMTAIGLDMLAGLVETL